MFAVIVLTANHYIVDAFAGFAVMMVGLTIALAARWFAVRRFPSEKSMRVQGWVPWLQWLCGVSGETKETAVQAERPA
jgi:hypothetical protein